MVRWIAICVGLFAVVDMAHAAVQSKKVSYKHGDVNCIGYLAWDDAIEGPRPGVLVVHEVWGLDAYAKRRVDQLASMGYIALAADMFGEGKTHDHPKDAMAMMAEIKQNVGDWTQRALDSLNVLKSQPQCDPTKIAAIGYCFGGSTVQQLAFAGTDIKAIVSFHGALVTPTPEQVKQTKAAILICNGADDTLISAQSIQDFRDAEDKNGGKYEFINYPGALHSFTVPEADETAKKFGFPLKYSKSADEKSWADMKALFRAKLGK